MLKLVLATASVLAMGTAAHAVTVANGGFELPDVGNGVHEVPTGPGLTGWTITTGSIDIVNDDYWVPHGGGQSIDLNGGAQGAISQLVSGFDVGKKYILSFWMAGNPYPVPVVKSLTASVGTTSSVYTFDVTGTTHGSMGWVQKTLGFTATATSLTLSFASNDFGITGAALDDVSISAVPVAAVPLPAGGLLLMTGLLGIGALSRRRRG